MKSRHVHTHILNSFANKRGVKLHNGMYVRYTGRGLSPEATRYMADTPVHRDGIYTVSHCVDEGSHVWLYVRELPGVRCYADGFVQTPHMAEDHWELTDHAYQPVA